MVPRNPDSLTLPGSRKEIQNHKFGEGPKESSHPTSSVTDRGAETEALSYSLYLNSLQ